MPDTLNPKRLNSLLSTAKSLHFLSKSGSERKTLIDVWRADRLGELNFVGLAGALIAATVTTCIGWRSVEEFSIGTIVCWHGSLLYALLSICTAVQQNIALSRINSYEDRDERICKLTGARTQNRPPQPSWVLCWRSLLVWSTPVFLLNLSIGLLLLGLGIMIFNDAAHLGSHYIKIAISFAVFSAVGMVAYFFHVVCINSAL